MFEELNKCVTKNQVCLEKIEDRYLKTKIA